MAKQTLSIIAAAAATTALVSLGACSSAHSTAAKPSVAACTKAYPAWFAASYAAHEATGQDTPTPTPAECKGLTDAQLTKIAADYLASLSQ